MWGQQAQSRDTGDLGACFRAIGALVPQSVGTAIPVTVLRGDSRLELQMTPQRWAGRGLLGCLMNPRQ
eukprot:s6940_g3.t1